MGDTGQYTYQAPKPLSPYNSLTTGTNAKGEPLDKYRSSSPLRRQFESQQMSVIFAVLGALAVLYISTKDTKALQGQIDGLRQANTKLGGEIAGVKKSAHEELIMEEKSRKLKDEAEQTQIRALNQSVD